MQFLSGRTWQRISLVYSLFIRRYMVRHHAAFLEVHTTIPDIYLSHIVVILSTLFKFGTCFIFSLDVRERFWLPEDDKKLKGGIFSPVFEPCNWYGFVLWFVMKTNLMLYSYAFRIHGEKILSWFTAIMPSWICEDFQVARNESFFKRFSKSIKAFVIHGPMKMHRANTIISIIYLLNLICCCPYLANLKINIKGLTLILIEISC
jgi:hypothetical protein